MDMTQAVALKAEGKVLSVMKSLDRIGSGDAGAGNGRGSRSSWGRFDELFVSRSAPATAASTEYSGAGADHGRRYATLSLWADLLDGSACYQSHPRTILVECGYYATVVDLAPVGGLAFNVDGGLVLVVLGRSSRRGWGVMGKKISGEEGELGGVVA